MANNTHKTTAVLQKEDSHIEDANVVTVMQDNGEMEIEHASEHHEGPHIPLIQGEPVWGPISNITLTLIVFAVAVSVFAFFANKALKKGEGKLRIAVLTFVKFFDEHLRWDFGSKKAARRFFPLIVGMFSVIFFGNLFGLIIDWVGISITPTILMYLRPMHSDLNTTLVLALVTVVMIVVTQVKSHGGIAAAKSYLFNFQGEGLMSKCINVFVGWLHIIGLPAMLASLSLRLFGNIFAGIVLVGVITFLGAAASAALFELGRLLAIPFWFFEVFVALIQALVFAGLMIANLKQAGEKH